MSGYTRQSAADIVPTAVVKAAPINTEFNKLRDAFTWDTTGATGHRHDGTSDEGSYVPLIADLEGINKVQTDAINNRISFSIEVASSSVEQLRVEDGIIYPVVTGDINLGSATYKFGSAWLSADLDVAGNTVLGSDATDTVTFTADVSSNVIPSATATYDLGTATDYWNNGYVTTGYITTANITTGVIEDLTVNGTADFTNTVLANVSDPTLAQHAATKNYVDTAVANLVDSAPGTLDTLNELAAALGDDPNFVTTINTSIGTKLSKAGDSMTGELAMGANKITGLATPTTGTDAVTKAYVDSVTGSLTDAAASAAAAAASATDAAASYDEFDDRYLGAKATAPAVDNDGDALTDGVLYYNTTDGFMYVYDTSTGWKLAGSAVNGTSSRATFTATASQTSFAVTYDIGFVDVYMNGVKLVAGTDFTATNGTSVELTVGAAAGDIIDIVAYGTFDLANALTPANNLADVADVSQARTNLGLVIGTDVQAWDAQLDDVAGLTPTASSVIIGDGTNFGTSDNSTGSIQMPTGTTAQRPTGVNGMIRYNSDDGSFEGYAAGEWGAIGGGLEEQTASTSSTTQASIATWAIATFQGMELTVVMHDTVATERTITKLLITHDGVTAVSTEYGIVSTDTDLATLAVDISGGNVRLLATAASANATNYKVKAVSFEV